MKQAKVINETEMKRLLAVIDAGQHSERNRYALMLSYYAVSAFRGIVSQGWYRWRQQS